MNPAGRAARAGGRLLRATALPDWFDERVVRLLALRAFDRRTDNAREVRWLGREIRQNPVDAWLLQELIVDDDVDFVIETGTLRGGSAYFLGTIFDLLGRGHVVSIDIAAEAVEHHDRVEYLEGSSVDPAVVARVRASLDRHGAERPLVVLDSDHRAPHVLAELRTYADFVPIGGHLVVQDGVVDELRRFRDQRPGPLVAIEEFLRLDARFEVDEARSGKFLVHYSPRGCLRRIR